jgi:DNA adenine methylase
MSKNGRNGRLIAFSWYGGKCLHLDWLLPLLPPAGHYVEPFGGGASVLLNRKASMMETYNDLNGDVVNFFKVLREKREALIEALQLTPLSRAEFNAAKIGENGLSDVERARRFAVLIQQGRNSVPDNPKVGWGFRVESSNGRWRRLIESLPAVADRLARTQIESRPALEVIKRYDSDKTLFYCDPPYPQAGRRTYKEYGRFEMTDDDHRKLGEVLNRVKGRAAVSSYKTKLYDEIFKGWRMIPAPKKAAPSSLANWAARKAPSADGRARKIRQEVLYCNYDARISDPWSHPELFRDMKPEERLPWLRGSPSPLV